MTPEEQRIAIAEACGWTANTPDAKPYLRQWLSPSKMDSNLYVMPDYLNSLDAMHEAEKTLGPKDYESFRWELWSLVKQPLVSEWNRAHLSATAAQRAEAFLRTLKLWNE